MKRIFLADDHAILREGLRTILEAHDDIEIVGEACDGRSALLGIQDLRPDIALLDISMDKMTGIEVARQVCKYYPEVKIIMLSRHDNQVYVDELLKMGVNGYVLKDNASDDLRRSIDAVAVGETYLSPKLIKSVVTTRFSPQPVEEMTIKANLTHRELEVLKLIAESHSNNEIATMLFISPRTVKAHRSNMMKKLGAKRSLELVRHAIQLGLVET